MSGTNATDTTASGAPLSSLPAADTVAQTDGIFGVFAGEAKLATPSAIVQTGMPDDVVREAGLNEALSSSALGQYVAQAGQHADAAGADADRSQTAAAASSSSASQAAKTGAQVATIAQGVDQTAAQIQAVADSTQQALTGVTSDANAAKVLLTAALNGNAPLTYRGYWDAATNAPALTGGTGTEGDLYIVSVAGVTSLDGNASWSVGDGAWFTGGKWVYFARAGWAAVAQEVTALRALQAGSGRITDGDQPLEILDAAGFLVASIGQSGTFASDSSGSPDFGLLATGVYAGPVRIMEDGQEDVAFVDPSGFPLRLSPLSVPRQISAMPVTERPPGAYDDAMARYAAGDLWQHDGECLTCLYDNAGRAVWQSDLTVPALPGDQFASSLAAAYGTSRLVSAYAGPLMDVVAVNGSASSLITLTQDADGLLSQVDLRHAAGLDAAGSVLAVVRLYDQSGGGRHADAPGYVGTPASLSNVNTANCPHIGVRKNGQYDLVSWSAEPAAAQPLVIPSSLSLSGAASSVLFYGAVSSCNCPRYTTYSLFGLGSADGQAVTLTVGGGVETGRLTLSDYNPAAILGGSNITLNCEQGLVALTFPGSDSAALSAPFSGVADSAITGVTGLSARTFAGAYIGSSPQGGGNSSAMQMSGLVLLKSAVTAGDIATARNNAAALYGYKPQIRTRIDCFGSSTTQGYLNKDGWCWPQMLHDYLNAPVEVRSVSVAGSTAADFLQYTIANVLADAAATPRRRMAITWYGNNDVNGGQSVATIVANNASIHRQLRAAGYEHLFILGQYNVTLNAAIRQAVADGTIDADGFVDPWSAPPLSNHSDAALYHDGTHPTPAADRLAASIIAQTLNQFL